MLEAIFIIVFLAVLFDISNGWNDSANAIATVVSTRVLSPLQAVTLSAFMNILGAFSSTAVAKTIGSGIVAPASVSNVVVGSALLSSFLWNSAMTVIGMPVSASHALIGSLMGAAVAFKGMGILQYAGLTKIFLALLISPIFGILGGYCLMKAILAFFGTRSPGKINKVFGRLQIVSSAFMAFSHGSNDAQKVMGIITLSMVSGGFLHSLEVPFWVILVCAMAMGLGTAMGGWRVIKTLGVQMLKLQPIHGFAAETSASLIIIVASFLGLPVSTTHVISTSIMGVGATQRIRAVRWGVAGKIVMAWLFTLPMSIVMAWLICKALLRIF
ncbi:MAG: inorganic phosphate transporter [bacterium]